MEENKKLSASFKDEALKQGMSENDIHEIIIDIFEVAYHLELRENELRGVFLALNQMVIKNKITTEGLRRQMGERIPGVFGIMAKSLGITLPELDKMVKNGEIISCNILPKFAIELEKAFRGESELF
jgi:tape measure domain-containing protein